MIQPIRVIAEREQSPPLSPFPLPPTQGVLLSERMGLPRREIPAWARTIDWSAEEDDE